MLIGFGCPRSGTTFLGTIIDSRGDRLLEQSFLHPIHSSGGLIALSQAFKHATFIRIVRHPLEIVASCLALGLPELREYEPVEEEIATMIEAERQNVEAQRHELWGKLHEIEYEKLAKKKYRLKLRERFGFSTQALDSFGKDPVRPGRLSAGLLGRDLLGERRPWWEERLKEWL